MKQRFIFNPNSNVILIFGKDSCPERVLSLAGSEVAVRNGDEHMDISLEKCFVRKHIQKGRQSFFMAQTIGSKCVLITLWPLWQSWSRCRTNDQKIMGSNPV